MKPGTNTVVPSSEAKKDQSESGIQFELGTVAFWAPQDRIQSKQAALNISLRCLRAIEISCRDAVSQSSLHLVLQNATLDKTSSEFGGVHD